MKTLVTFAALLVAVGAATPTAAQEMNAQEFYERGKKLESKGPLALFDGDLKRLEREGNAAAERAIARNDRASKKQFCIPANADRMDPREFLRAMEDFTAAQRRGWTSTELTVRIFARKYPCR
ncbi:hypothetical protein WJT74_09060 [Sphingomicrobium sp. XHP0239]|uniref:hypothetical protein n=1 Tax=Sphingomicrobium maritimum TaxID=3133972 RepID=UPI0031CCCD68